MVPSSERMGSSQFSLDMRETPITFNLYFSMVARALSAGVKECTRTLRDVDVEFSFYSPKAHLCVEFGI